MIFYALLTLVVICWVIIYFMARRASRYILQPEPGKDIGPNPPLVSIIVPARNEQANLLQCLTSLSRLDYPDYEVIVIDDHSTDQTLALAESFARTNSNFKVIRSKDLPPGWTGKNWANYQGVEVSSGERLLFTDADTEFYPHALSCALSYFQEENLDMLTLLPQANMTNIWDKITLPLIGGSIIAWCPPHKVNDPHSPLAAAIGAFILIKRKTYRAVGSHEAICGKIVDDRELGILVKSSGFKLHLLNGTQLYRVRMYDSFRDLWEGWSKNFFLGMNKSYLGACVAVGIIFLLMLLPFFAMVGWCGSSGPCLAVLTADIAIIWIYVRIQRIFNTGLSAVYGIYLPVGAIIVIGIIVNSIIRYHRGISWSGRKYHKSSVDV